MAMEAVRSGNLPVDAGDGELDEAEPMDWWLVGSNFSLALARDLSGSTCQRGGEKLLKRRVPPGLHAEMIKSVPKMARKSYLSEVAAGRTPFGARTATAKLVIRSPVYYLSSALPRLVTDMAVDVLRIFFPKHWRSRLTVPSFYRNARLKLIKYALQAVCSLCVGSLVPLVWCRSSARNAWPPGRSAA
uniref:Uncharacterized protein n=2 Tax=Chrysotila carterae TaxID=13221 RepID=A0A7S4EV36_CHRCT